MKYISRNANLAIVLKKGLPGNAALGTASTPGIYARFKEGILETSDPEIINLLETTQAYGTDYRRIEEGTVDPYESSRIPTEPSHTIKEIKYGHVEKTINGAPTPKVNPELQKFITEQAVLLAKEMLPGMMKAMLSELRQEAALPAPEAEKEAEKPKAKKKKETAETPS